MTKAFESLDGMDGQAAAAELRPLMSLSRNLARIERLVAGFILLAVFCVVLLNVIARALGTPLIWADELAIYGMAWAAFVGASAGLAGRDHIAITLLSDALPRAAAARLAFAVDAVLLVLLISLAIILWRWFDPIDFLLAASPEDYAAGTFNFMHQEPTTTLGIGKIWIWLVLPVFVVAAILHVAARLSAGAKP